MPTPTPGEPSDAAWFHDLMTELADAYRGSDHTRIAALREQARQRGPHLEHMIEQVLTAADVARAFNALGVPMPPQPIGYALKGQRMCDFCTDPHPIAYYPFEEFEIAGPATTYLSGDRMYVCAHCQPLVEAGDWRTLRRWVGPAGDSLGVRLLWMGFANNRTGPAVTITADHDPEEGRTP